MDAQNSRTALFERGRIRAAALAATALSSVLAPSAGVTAALAGTAVAPHVAAQVHATAAMSTSPIVGLAPSGTSGYWMTSSTGGVFAFGSAAFHGSLGGVTLAKPIVGMAATPNAGGYWLVASDGGVFSFGNARFHGSTGGVRLAKPIVGMASTPSGNGYWLVASDGGVFSFGDARFHGSTGAVQLAKPIVGMAATSTGNGYWLVASDGGVFNFGDAGYHGSAVNFNASSGGSSVGIIPVGSGYWIPNNLGQVDSLGAPQAPQPSGTVVSTSSTSYQLPWNVMPSTSVKPSTAMAQACWVANANPANCDAAALADINAARAGEGYGPLPLPSNYESLSLRQQLIAVANAERTSRGLPALAENSNLDSLAQQGAQAGADPTGPNGYAWGSNIAWGDPTALAADFGWMYDDGVGSENIECTYAGQAGCWGHRENILAGWGGASGAGVFLNGTTMQLTQLFVQNY